MGCDNSKQQLQPNIPDSQEEGTIGFTETQIDTIRSTWPLLSRNMVRVGTDVFVRIFTEVPTVKELFSSFNIVDVNDLHKMPTFRAHAEMFMQVLHLVVDNLETPYSELNHELMVLGARHATFSGFKPEYFKFYVKCLIQVWELELGEEFILEVRDCWKIVFDFLVDNMTEGYELALRESTTKHCQNGVKTLTVSDNGNSKSQNGHMTSQNKRNTSPNPAVKKNKSACIMDKNKKNDTLCEVKIT
ncbi:hypothetical protein LOTGIDRAFT_233216 [Lottia gigantea]|uniref:Globin n=1 Tax=Lottia gigantea TaxID=225164 RepID=V4A611_LOTGI|nr:hypothetical protein LOTGIDRAFT_233216 [Lottia gigantea]ESO92167.1 hypothetical protein LOTGIDRAFT_233216 [Lottia gigantea]